MIRVVLFVLISLFTCGGFADTYKFTTKDNRTYEGEVIKLDAQKFVHLRKKDGKEVKFAAKALNKKSQDILEKAFNEKLTDFLDSVKARAKKRHEDRVEFDKKNGTIVTYGPKRISADDALTEYNSKIVDLKSDGRYGEFRQIVGGLRNLELLIVSQADQGDLEQAMVFLNFAPKEMEVNGVPVEDWKDEVTEMMKLKQQPKVAKPAKKGVK